MLLATTHSTGVIISVCKAGGGTQYACSTTPESGRLPLTVEVLVDCQEGLEQPGGFRAVDVASSHTQHNPACPAEASKQLQLVHDAGVDGGGGCCCRQPRMVQEVSRSGPLLWIWRQHGFDAVLGCGADVAPNAAAELDLSR